MNILVILVPAALLLGLLGLFAFFWSVRASQYDDPEGAARRILGDDSLPPPPRPAEDERRPGDGQAD